MQNVIKKINNALSGNIKWAFFGGVAIAIYNNKFYRNNEDIDIIIEDNEAKLKQLISGVSNCNRNGRKKMCVKFDNVLIEFMLMTGQNEIDLADGKFKFHQIITKKFNDLLLKNIYKYIDKYTGCLIFLDPEGPELYWDTIQFLSKINKVDLLMLYPYDMSLVRLTKDYKDKLNKFYGSEKWLEIYKAKENFNPEKRKIALLNFYIENLNKLGFQYVVYKQIRRNLRSGKALYHLILATHSPIGKKIMEGIFDKELDGQQKIKLI